MSESPLLTIAIYGVATLTLIASIVSFTIFDSLKTITYEISTTPHSKECKILSAVSTYFTNDYKAEPGLTLELLRLSPGVQIAVGRYGLSYSTLYFPTHAECVQTIAQTKFVCVPQDIYYTCQLQGVSITLTGLKVNPPSASNATRLVNHFFNSSNLCGPFQLLPPYQCSSYKTISYFSIISQSFGITLAVLAGLIAIIPFIVKKIESYRTPEPQRMWIGLTEPVRCESNSSK